MKRSIRRSFRVELFACAMASAIFAILTEAAMGFAMAFISAKFSVLKGGRAGRAAAGQNSYARQMISGYDEIRTWNANEITIFAFIVVVTGFFLFAFYFLAFTKRVTKDIIRISKCISQIASGDLDAKVEDVDRSDELGEIAAQVNSMSEEIKRLVEAERDALQENKDIIACVAHDLRTPLTSVIGYLQLAMDADGHTGEEREKYVRIAADKAQKMQGLIEELFSYTKLINGAIKPRKSKVDAVKLVEQVIEEFYPLFEKNGVKCILRKKQDELFVNIDGELIARAVSNLVSNAVKYGKDGKEAYVDIDRQGDKIYIRVTNFGTVIPKQSIGRIFDKFYRVEDSRSAETGGTGLGLNIAYEIALLHGGTIDVYSGIKGTRFTLALPMESDDQNDMKGLAK